MEEKGEGFMKRRDFMKGSLAAAAALALPGCATSPKPFSRIRGANDDVRIGVIRLRIKGHHHVECLRELPGARVVAVCDADESILRKEVEEFKASHLPVDAYVDLRRLLDNPNVDAVVIATPNHWHALAAIWACQAGKDVYVEKPVCHNVWEGRQMVRVARHYRRIVQTGTQKRSDPGIREAFDSIRKGDLGKILYARGLCYKRRESIGKVDGPQPIPESVNYDLWCGPAPKGPLMRQQLHYDWHWVWPTGNGDIGNQGVHEVDLCRWALGQTGFPPRVFSLGGRFGYDDDGETPNTQILVYDYSPAPILFEVRGLPRKKDDSAMDHYRGIRIGRGHSVRTGILRGRRWRWLVLRSCRKTLEAVRW
jgi:predicted dehydrogenase